MCMHAVRFGSAGETSKPFNFLNGDEIHWPAERADQQEKRAIISEQARTFALSLSLCRHRRLCLSFAISLARFLPQFNFVPPLFLNVSPVSPHLCFSCRLSFLHSFPRRAGFFLPRFSFFFWPFSTVRESQSPLPPYHIFQYNNYYCSFPVCIHRVTSLSVL